MGFNPHPTGMWTGQREVAASGVPIDRYPFETIEMMKDRQEIYLWRREIEILRARLAGATVAEAEAKVPRPRIRTHVMDVSFDEIPQPEERAYFMNLPTSFLLPAESIDKLREVAGRLLRQSQDYQTMLQEFGGGPPR